MNKDELIEEIYTYAENEGYELRDDVMQKIVSTVLDAVEEGFKTNAGRMPDWSDKEEYLQIFSEAINKLR